MRSYKLEAGGATKLAESLASVHKTLDLIPTVHENA